MSVYNIRTESSAAARLVSNSTARSAAEPVDATVLTTGALIGNVSVQDLQDKNSGAYDAVVEIVNTLLKPVENEMHIEEQDVVKQNYNTIHEIDKLHTEAKDLLKKVHNAIDLLTDVLQRRGRNEKHTGVKHKTRKGSDDDSSEYGSESD